MTVKQNGFEGAPASGDVDTAAGGVGDAFNQIIKTGTGSVTYTDANTAHGTRAAVISADGSSQALVEFAVTAAGSVAARVHVYFGALPSTTMDMVTIRAAGNTCKVQVNASGSVAIQNAAGTTVQTWVTELSTGTDYRLEVVATKGTTTSNGRIQAAVYTGDSETANQSYDSGTTVNTGTADMSIVRVGNITTAASATFTIDDVAAADQATFIGAVSSPIAGTPTDDGPGWRIDATGLTGGAGALTHSIDPSVGVIEDPEGVFWVPQGASSVEYTVTTTDGVTPVDNLVTVPAAGVDGNRRKYYDGADWV